MSFANSTPYLALDVPLEDHDGREVVVAIVKATFTLSPSGKLVLAEPAPIRPGEIVEDPEATDGSLRYPSDLCIEKVGADVIILGDAVSPRPVEAMDVAVKVRDTTVPLRVHGERVFYRGATGVMIGPAARFERMPIVYERAYGGTAADQWIVESHNPAGVGVAADPKDLVDRPAPQIEHPARPHRSASDKHPPVGLRAIRTHWSPRKELCGTFDAAWEATRAPMMPADFDVRFNNVAHPSLQVPALAAGDAIAVLGMSESGVVRFELPDLGVRIVGRSERSGRRETRPQIDTVLVEPGERRVEITLRQGFPLGRGLDRLREIRVESA